MCDDSSLFSSRVPRAASESVRIVLTCGGARRVNLRRGTITRTRKDGEACLEPDGGKEKRIIHSAASARLKKPSRCLLSVLLMAPFGSAPFLRDFFARPAHSSLRTFLYSRVPRWLGASRLLRAIVGGG